MYEYYSAIKIEKQEERKKKYEKAFRIQLPSPNT